MESEREVLTYAQFGIAIRELGHVIVEDGYKPDIILSIARGGLLIGGALGYAIGVKNTFTMSVEFYTGVDERLPMPVVLPPVPNRIDLAGAKVLIADDVADTGATLSLVRNFCAGHVAEARSAVLYSKPHSLVKPDYAWKETDKWIDFPWSSQPPIGQ
jgi:hypoxanthine phosphoribosyltransferase